MAMTTIEPAYISFEQAKWLKEKGFFPDIESQLWNNIPKINLAYNTNGEKYNPPMPRISHIKHYLAPEQWQVVEWLRVVHGIWVSCYPTSNPLKCQFRIYKNDNGVMGQVYDDYMGKEFNSPQEAYSAAFDYIKDNNLI